MNIKIQSILIRRKSKVFVDYTPVEAVVKTGQVGAVIANFGSLGYVCSADLVKTLSNLDTIQLDHFYKKVFPILQKQVGMTYSQFKPMYPNFPTQVANASDEELYINAIMHYFGDAIGERITPVYEKEVRFPFCESTTPRFLGLASDDEVSNMWLEIFESKASPSVQDKEDINTYFTGPMDMEMYMNRKPIFSNKEKMSYALGVLLKQDKIFAFNIWVVDNIKTATDVLRLAVAYSGGDESLTKVTKFGKFPRPVRKLLLGLLNEMDQFSVQEDMRRFEGMWKRLGEKLHPGEYTFKYPNISLSFYELRNNTIITTNSKIELFTASSDWVNLLSVLKTRPGDFARRLNSILSKTDNKFKVIDAFKSVVDKVSSPVLWQLYGYFNSREQQLYFRNRIFLPKTPVAIVSENNLVPIGKGYEVALCQIILDSLIKRYSVNPLFSGNVWIDPICDNLLIPSGNRSTSTALKQVARGSRFKIGKYASTVRLFVYWSDLKGDNGSGDRNYRDPERVDLDLSAEIFDKDWKSIGHCSWTNLRYKNFTYDECAMYHSGDITSAPNGASEFLDIDLSKLDDDAAYIACNVYCYTGQKMNELNIGYCGWMERDYPNSGEIFEPKSVTQRADLTSDATSTCPMVLDVKSKEIIWADLPLNLVGGGCSTENTMHKSIATAELMTRASVTKTSLWELFYCHVLAGNVDQVYNKEEASFVIAEDGDLSPYDVAKITQEWL